MAVIGIPLRYNSLSDGRDILYLGEMVRRSFQKAGAFILPLVQVQDINYNSTKYEEFEKLNEEEKKLVDKYLDMVDGVVFPGGYKVSVYDEYLLERCIERDIPTLGICLGMQLMGSYKGKFTVMENNSSINHLQEDDNVLSHKVMVNKDSFLYKILEKDEILVNSFHRFHVIGSEYFSVNARSEDDYIEGIEFKDKKFILGLQWHPEISYDFDENSKKIIDYFINICSNS